MYDRSLPWTRFAASLASLPLLWTLGCGQGPSPEHPAPTTAGDTQPKGDQPDGKNPGKPDPDANKEPSAEIFEKRASDLARITDSEISDELRQAHAKGSLDLSFELMRALEPEAKGNQAVSALSLRTAFGMVHGMARGETQQEIAQALHLPEDPEKAQSLLNATDLALLSRNLPKDNEREPVVFSTANRVFVSKEDKPSKAYLDLLAKNYGTGVFAADFKQKAPEILEEINRWVSEQTYTRIPSIVTADDINTTTSWVLVNAIYFKAPWSFAMDSSQKGNFTHKDGRKSEVDFVGSSQLSTTYGQADGATWVQLPVRGREIALTLILPDEGKFDELRGKLSGERVSTWFAQEKRGTVDLLFPKFKVESERMNLLPALQAKGMKKAFGQADFGGYGENGESLSAITFVYQKVFVAADENGVEAAAATAVGSEESAAEVDLELAINRPFFFLVHERTTGVALFAGQVLDPGK